ncbi:MAG: DUF4198 domain-containing protein [Pseudomonadota bacterium]
MRALILAASLGLFSITTSAHSHEFWIDPERFFVNPGAPVRADLRTGENFRGGPSPFLPNRFRRFEIAGDAGFIPVESTIGDRPAMNQPLADGLAVIVHETQDFTLTYQEFAKFEKFAAHKDAEWVIDAHKARGLPETGFGEVYSRYAKSLVSVGSGTGSDRAVGLKTEIVALANPYTDDLSQGMPVRVLYLEAPRAEAQVEVFEEAPSGAVRVFLLKTDARGEVRVPVRPGHTYMLDSVVLRKPSNPAGGEVWESLWANLTFAVPN